MFSRLPSIPLKLISILYLLIAGNFLFAQTTGKIFGIVTDANSGDPLIGVNILIEGTGMGASTDGSGEFFIINVPPAKYEVRAEYIGYQSVIVADVQVSVNRTASIPIKMKEAVVEGQEVVVVAEKISLKKDQTASVKNVSAEQIAALPVETVDDVIQMQAGVVEGHFRGGRLTDVSYLVDGVQIDEGFSGQSNSLEVETEAVQDLEVITGTFNAEYGRALSGIVNVVTKDGSDKFHGSVSGHASNYLTANDDIFIGNSSSDFDRNQDFKMQLTGPLLMKNVYFLVNYRYQDTKGHLNGINRFLPDNYSDLNAPIDTNQIGESVTPWDFYANVGNDQERYYSENTGDNSFIPLTWQKEYSFLGKLTFKPFTRLKFSVLFSRDNIETPRGGGNHGYDHSYKYKPLGRAITHANTDFYLFQLNHLISRSMFHDFKVSYTNNASARYLYEDPLDPRYISDNYNRSSAGGFRAGGQDRGRTDTDQKNYNVKYDITWQVNKQHSLKSGFIYTTHEIYRDEQIIRNSLEGTPGATDFYYDPVLERVVFNEYQPELFDPQTVVGVDQYTRKPYEFAAYLQDKMEFTDMVINLGVRYDYFNANTVYPTQLRNPANQLSFPNNPERMSEYPDADPQIQVSPRFGLSYKVGNRAVLRFSYGHFFQMPPFFAMFQNYKFLVPPNDFSVINGNPQIKAERTVQYEMGLWQEFMDGLSLEVSVYYRDIYDLQTAIIATTYNQIKYGVYSNKDYGNAKGLEVKFDFNRGPFSAYLNYTLQFTRGNADTPNSGFDRAGNNQDPITRLVPLAWDQRHTANVTTGYHQQRWGTSLTTYYNSGLPYTIGFISQNPLAKQSIDPNNGVRPSSIDMDLTGYYDFPMGGNKKIRLTLSVYNLLDRLNEETVYSTTGRAYTRILNPTEELTFRSNYNNLFDSIENPGMYAVPREVKLGVGFSF